MYRTHYFALNVPISHFLLVTIRQRYKSFLQGAEPLKKPLIHSTGATCTAVIIQSLTQYWAQANKTKLIKWNKEQDIFLSAASCAPKLEPYLQMINHTSSWVFITGLMSLGQAFQTWLTLAVATYWGGTLCVPGPLRGVAGKDRKEVGRTTKNPCSWTFLSRPQGWVSSWFKVSTKEIQWIAKSQLNSVEWLFPTKKFEI